jgi:hypothetical protein
MARIIGAKSKSDKTPKTWRECIAVHPAAGLFPRPSAEELRALGEDIKQHGLTTPITIFAELLQPGDLNSGFKYSLLDGISRLDAMEAANVPFRLVHGKDWDWRIDLSDADSVCTVVPSYNVDPYDYAISANIHRRHLTTEQRLQLVDEVIKAKPDLSSRQVAKQTKVSTTTAVKRRKKLEAAGDVSTVDTSTDTKGRKQPRRKSAAAKSKPTAEPASDIRSKYTISNGQSRDEAHVLRLVATDPPPDPLIKPTAPSCSGSSTTSAAETAVRILIELLAHGTKADPGKVAELLRWNLQSEQVEQLLDWLGQLREAS